MTSEDFGDYESDAAAAATGDSAPPVVEGPKRGRELEAEDLRTLMSMDVGRRVIWRLLHKSAGIHEQSWCSDPGATAFNEGKRSVGLKLLHDICEANEMGYLTMLQEARQQDGWES